MVTSKRHKKTTTIHKTTAVSKKGLQTECQMTAKTIRMTLNKETQNDYKDTQK